MPLDQVLANNEKCFLGEYDKPLAQIAQNKDKPYNSEVADVCISLLTEGGFKFKS